jgi:hypothetical protein
MVDIKLNLAHPRTARMGEGARMMRAMIALFVLLIPCSGAAQQRKIPVSVSQVGHDQVGSLFATAFKQDLSHSARYEFMRTEVSKSGLRFYVEFITVDAADGASDQGKRSVISVVIQDMGLPNSFPVANMWYHKVIVVDRQTVGKISNELLEDMDARWYSYIKNSAASCPKEKL